MHRHHGKRRHRVYARKGLRVNAFLTLRTSVPRQLLGLNYGRERHEEVRAGGKYQVRDRRVRDRLVPAQRADNCVRLTTFKSVFVHLNIIFLRVYLVGCLARELKFVNDSLSKLVGVLLL